MQLGVSQVRSSLTQPLQQETVDLFSALLSSYQGKSPGLRNALWA
jgi:hypothetical protein